MLRLFRGRESTGEFLPKLLLSKLEGPWKGGDGETLRPSHLAGSFSALGNSTRWLGFQGPWRQFVTSGDLSVYVVDNAKLVAGAKGSVWGWGVCVCVCILARATDEGSPHGAPRRLWNPAFPPLLLLSSRPQG